MNLLIISDVPPCRQYTAGLVEETFCNILIRNNINFSLLLIQSDGIEAIIPNNIKNYADKIVVFKKKCEQCHGLNNISRFVSLLNNEFYSSKVLPRKAIKAFKDFSFDLIWGIIQGQSLIYFVASLAKTMNLSYNVQIWDPPEWWLRENKFSLLFYSRTMNKFKELLLNSNYCLTASPQMSYKYRDLFGCKTIELMPSLHCIKNSEAKLYFACENNNKFKIIFTGQKYARKELFSFLNVIDSLNWNFNGKAIEVNIFSNFVDEEILDKFPLVKQFGWLDQEQLHNEIATSDLAYCPYPFDEEMKIVSELSFPGKLVSYLHCTTPVFFHGPVGSSITSFAKQNGFNFVCESIKPQDIKVVLISALTSPALRKKDVELSVKVFNSMLSLKTMEKNILTSLNKFI